MAQCVPAICTSKPVPTRFLSLCIPSSFQITDASVIALARHCPQLQLLGLHCCRQISDFALLALAACAKAHSDSRKCPPLLQPDSSSSSSSTARRQPCAQRPSCGEGPCSSVSLQLFPSVPPVPNCRCHCAHPQCLRPALCSLNISGCLRVTAEAVQALCDACPRLCACAGGSGLNTGGCVALQGAVRCRCRGDQS